MLPVKWQIKWQIRMKNLPNLMLTSLSIPGDATFNPFYENPIRLVPTEGVEPTHSCEYQILSPSELADPPVAQPPQAVDFQGSGANIVFPPIPPEPLSPDVEVAKSGKCSPSITPRLGTPQGGCSLGRFLALSIG